MDRDQYQSLTDEAARRRSTGSRAGCEAAVSFLREQLDRFTDGPDRWDIYGLIAAEYELADDRETSVKIHALRSQEFPLEPMSWASQALSEAHAEQSDSQVRASIDRALALATEQNRFVRAVLRTRAEIAYHLSDAAFMEECVQMLLRDAPRLRAEDIAFPRSVAKMAEQMGLDKALLARLETAGGGRSDP